MRDYITLANKPRPSKGGGVKQQRQEWRQQERRQAAAARGKARVEGGEASSAPVPRHIGASECPASSLADLRELTPVCTDPYACNTARTYPGLPDAPTAAVGLLALHWSRVAAHRLIYLVPHFLSELE